MQTAQDILSRLENDNEALFQASEMQVEAFFKSNPSNEALVEHFSGRCANEYMNMVEVADHLKEMAPQGNRDMLKKIAKQILDEAVHFDLVAKVLEHLTGKAVDVQALLTSEAEGGGAKGARILENISKEDTLALHLYQFIAEGRAHRVWQRMADVCADPMIAKTYQKIAHDEKTHMEFGRQGLANVITPENQERAMQLAQQIRLELYNVSCMNCVEVPAARQMVVDAYGPSFMAH